MIIINEHKEEQFLNCVKSAAAEITKGDVYAGVSHSVSVSFEFDRLHSIEDVQHSFLAARVFKDNKAGNAFVNDPALWKKALHNAGECALLGKESPLELPSAFEASPLPWMFHKKNCLYTKEQLKDLGVDLLKAIQKISPKGKATVQVSSTYRRDFLANSSGFYGDERCSELSLLGGVFELDSQGSFIEFYEGEDFFENEPNIDKIIQPLLQRLEWSRKTVKIASGSYPVIFAPSAMGILLDPLLLAANGKTLNKGLSVLQGKIGELISSPKLSFFDYPLLYHGNSYTYDDEGAPSKLLPIIEKGVFKNFIFDAAEAVKQNTQSTGHASRGMGSLPFPQFSNICIDPGSKNFETLVAEIDRGVLLYEGLGEGQSNSLAGDFFYFGGSAFLIEKGKIKGRIKDCMFSGNSYSALKDIEEIGDTCHFEGGLHVPYTTIKNIDVSAGKEPIYG